MRSRWKLWSSVAILLASPLTALASWQTVGDGIEYQRFDISGPNKVFVTRMNRSNTNTYIESSIAQGRVSGGTQTVSSQAANYDDAIGYWGEDWGTRNDVVVAINGSYYNTSTGVPESGLVHSGWYAKRYDNVGGQSGFMWSLNRTASMGLCVTHDAHKNIITYATTNTQQFQGINRARGSNEIIIYTPQYDTDTNTDNTGSEVLVELYPEPGLIKPTPNYYSGTVRQIRQGAGSTMIPFDHIVLSASGTAATTMLNNLQVGDTIKVGQEIRHLVADCSTTRSGIDWTKSYAGISGNLVFLRDGVIQYGIDSTGDRHPRTAIGFNSSYVFYLVVDGRQSGWSIGMTIDELAEFFKYTLGADWACNQDGGGSSTMVVNGTIMNSPSDGSPRPVANGMLMCNVASKALSSAFSANEGVQATSSANVRLGPGTNYGTITSVSGGTQGTILDHHMRGVYAKGNYWWKVSFPSTTGWVAESLLSSTGDGGMPGDFCFTNNDLETFSSGVATDWTASGSSATYSASTDRYSGDYSQQILWTTSGSKVSAIYQRLWVEVGIDYTVGARFKMKDSNRINGTIRVDYSGGTDPSSVDLIWSIPATDWYNRSVSFTKTSGSDGWATIFFGGYGSVQANDWVRVDLVNPACTAATGPTITQQPVAQDVCAGGTADFSVSATGDGTLTYQWQFNQVDITGASSSTLQITSVDAGDVGNFRCVVTDSNGSTNSNEAALTLKTATSITSHPSNQQVTAGGTAQFSVTAGGAGTITYQWQKDGVNLSNGGDISGATSATLQIANCETADDGNYRCIATADCGSATSNAASLTVTSGGGYEEFIVESRLGGLNYSNYSEYGSWGNSSAKSTADGATSGIGSRYCIIGTAGPYATFVFTPSAGGTYNVYTTNCSTTNSGNPLVHHVSHAGGTSSVGVCQNTTCSPSAANTWLLLGQFTLNAGVQYSVILDGDTASGSAPSGYAGRSDAIKWESISTSPTAPSISQQPTNQTVSTGGTAQFTVIATGTTPLSYQWQKNGVNLSDGGNISGTATDNLAVSNCQSSDQANYRCVVTNAYGSATSDQASLTISSDPITYIVESRSGGQNYSQYSEVGSWYDSSSKSTAAGCTAGIGHRYCMIYASDARAIYRFTPTVSGSYDVYTTNCTTNNSGNPLIHKVTHEGGTATVSVCQNTSCANNAVNKWYYLGTYTLNGGTEYTVTLDGNTASGSAPSGYAGRSDAVMWEKP